VEGTPFGRYRLIELLGRGGMGEVWSAHDPSIDRVVAMKVLPAQFNDDPNYQERFRREARAAAGLDEPHVVPIHEVGEVDGRLYVTMRLIKGTDLHHMIADAPLSADRAIGIVEQIASALDAAHEIGLVHRDVKPSNILVAKNDFAYLIDFGIARAVNETGLTSTGSVIGTWAYMAPERLNTGHADARADVYALTCVLHEALTGERPFPGTSLEQQVVGHLTTPPPRPSLLRADVPQSLDAVVATGMAKDPDARFASARDMAKAARASLTAPMRTPAPPTSIAPAARATTVAPAPSPPRVPASPQPHGGDLAVGSRIEVTDDRYHFFGRTGTVVALRGGGDDVRNVIVRFSGESDAHAFRRDEVVRVGSSTAPRPAQPAAPEIDDLWSRVGIDPIRIITVNGTFLTLRCYLDDAPVFLGNGKQINAFRSGRVLRRYLASETRNDMSSLDTYDDVRAAALDDSLPLGAIAADNTYLINGLAHDIAGGPDSVDREQLELAIELLTDIGDYVRNPLVRDNLRAGRPLGDLVEFVFADMPMTKRRPSGDTAATQWRRLEDFLDSRLRVDGRFT